MKKKISAIVAGIVSTVVLSTAGLSTNVFATPNKPYDSADVSISSNADSATASITRCSCNPVDNYLMAAIRVQYYDGSNYHWDPEGENTYYFSEGTNVYSESKSISRNIAFNLLTSQRKKYKLCKGMVCSKMWFWLGSIF